MSVSYSTKSRLSILKLKSLLEWLLSFYVILSESAKNHLWWGLNNVVHNSSIYYSVARNTKYFKENSTDYISRSQGAMIIFTHVVHISLGVSIYVILILLSHMSALLLEQCQVFNVMYIVDVLSLMYLIHRMDFKVIWMVSFLFFRRFGTWRANWLTYPISKSVFLSLSILVNTSSNKS